MVDIGPIRTLLLNTVLFFYASESTGVDDVIFCAFIHSRHYTAVSHSLSLNGHRENIGPVKIRGPSVRHC